MSNGHMLVTPAAIANGSADTETVAQHIDQLLDDLKAYLAPMVASWSGDASTDYNAEQARWDTAAGELNTILHEIATALGTAEGNYNSAESTNLGIWAR